MSCVQFCVSLLAVSFIILCHPYAIKFCGFYELSPAVTVSAVEIIRLLPKIAVLQIATRGQQSHLKYLQPVSKVFAHNYFTGDRAEISQSIIILKC